MMGARGFAKPAHPRPHILEHPHARPTGVHVTTEATARTPTDGDERPRTTAWQRSRAQLRPQMRLGSRVARVVVVVRGGVSAGQRGGGGGVLVQDIPDWCL